MSEKWLKNVIKDFWKYNFPLYRRGDRLWGMRGAVGDYQEGKKTLFAQGLFEQSTTAKERLGTKRELDDGRVFVYVSFTAASLVAGHLVSKVQTPKDCTIAAADVLIDIAGAKSITVTTATATADAYRDGFMMIKAGTNIGQMYKIRGNGATDGIASGRIAVELYDALQAVFAVDTTIALHENPWKSLLINPAVANNAATTGECVMGMTTRIFTYVDKVLYGWIQTKGIGALLIDGTTVGDEPDEAIVVPGTSEGHGICIAAGAAAGYQKIATLVEGVDLTAAEANLVVLDI